MNTIENLIGQYTDEELDTICNGEVSEMESLLNRFDNTYLLDDLLKEIFEII